MKKLYYIFLFLGFAHFSFGQITDVRTNYELAFDEMNQMLKGEIPISFKRAVFLTENAYLENQISYEEFQKTIGALANLTKAVVAADGLDYSKKDRKQVLLAGSIYRVMKDTLVIENPITNTSFKKYPYTYDTADFWGAEDWTKMFVTKLLYTESGNCHSLPLLYKILADELGAEAYLSITPNHTYIKQWNDKTGWYNTELTSGRFPYDAEIKNNSYIKHEAIVNGVYMDTLTSKENISYTITDLAQGFIKKFGYDNIETPVRWLEVALAYYPDFPNAIILKSELLKKKYESLAAEKGEKNFLKPKDGELKSKFEELEKSYYSIHQIEYRRMPKEMYLNWLYRVRNDTTRKPYKFESPQPFKEQGYKVTVMTASDGYNYEFYDQEDTTRIGTVVINRLTGKIVKFIKPEKDDFSDEVISRMYDPYVGRFWQTDPLAEDFHDLSPYNFVENNPISNTDPDGMSPIGIHDEPAGLASTFIKPDGTIIEHRDDDDFGIYVVTDEAAWEANGKTNEGLSMVGIENRAFQYTPGQKINLMDKNQNRLAPSPGNIDPDYTLESMFIPLFGWLKGTKLLRFGGVTFKVTDKIAKQLAKRGWSDDLINSVLKSPHASRQAMNKATKSPATAYFARDGSYVVVDDVTKEVIQISDKTNIQGWIPDSSIINPYIPKK
jgi:RHS repeat-associated protein